MRTTVTLDPDVEALLRTAMRERGLSFKEAVNAALRAGLTQNTRSKHSFVQRTFALGAEQNFRWDKALATADATEDEELTRKLSVRK
jgi:Arc/MetJ family transcription regulator